MIRRATLLFFALAGLPGPAAPQAAPACGAAVCIVSRSALGLTHEITFDDLQSSLGIGRPIDGLLIRPGARFGEHFAGQTIVPNGIFDDVTGAPKAPLTARPGPPGGNLGALRLGPTTVLQGHGPLGYPRDAAVGEGAIAVEFDNDQAALAFDLRGGEDGTLTVLFLRRDGSEITRLAIRPIAEESYGFARAGNIADIAGILILNTDPEGIAIDNLAFDKGHLTG